MFDAALGRQGFKAEARDTRGWNGKQWSRSNHNLDRIVTKDGIAYGIEIKNTQNYIARDELTTKLDMCAFLGIKPLFIMRFAPKSYMNEIYRRGGFGLLFEDQMYPLGHTLLVEDVRQHLGLKVHSPRDVPEGHIQRLLRWHQGHLGGR